MSDVRIDKFHSERTELEVVGAILADSERYLPEALARLRDKDSFTGPSRPVWWAICSVHADGVLVDDVSVRARLGRSGAMSEDYEQWVCGLVEDPESIESFVGWVDVLVRRRWMRRYQRLSTWLARALERLDDPADLARELMDELQSVWDPTVSEPVPLSEVVERAQDQTQRLRESGGTVGLDLGIDGLSRVGAFAEKTVTIIGARTSVGKTDFGLTLFRRSAAYRHVCLFVSLEMSAETLVNRMVSHHSGVSLQRLAEAQNTYVVDVAYGEQARKVGYIWEVGSRLSLEQLESGVKRLNARSRLDLVVIDYLQLMGPRSSKHREQEVAAISAGIKRLAMSLSLPIVALAQVNRDFSKAAGSSADSAPQLHHLRDSGSIEQDADMVIMLDRPWLRTGEESQRRMLKAYVRKSRHSSIGWMEFDYDPSTHSIEEVR